MTKVPIFDRNNHGIVEPVSGCGKEKYKFKKNN